MDYLMLIDRVRRRNPTAPEAQFLVSGCDPVIQESVLQNILTNCQRTGDLLIVVDDTGGAVDYGVFSTCGYPIQNGFTAGICLYNPFQVGTLQDMGRTRRLLTLLGYSEKETGKFFSYLQFLRHLETLKIGGQPPLLTVQTIGNYTTVPAMEEQLQTLVDTGIIDERQQRMLLAKYMECSCAAADFEDQLFLLLPFLSGQPLEQQPGQVLVFPTGSLGEDIQIRRIALQLVQFWLETRPNNRMTLILFDRGYGEREFLCEFLLSLPPSMRVHLFSEDAFTLCGNGMLAMLLGRFPARVYGRHAAMASAEAVERVCGEIDVIQHAYNVTYDRHMASNRPWDLLLGRNKAETYAQTSPVREPRYRKEMILSFPQGQGIVDYMGNSSLFSVS